MWNGRIKSYCTYSAVLYVSYALSLEKIYEIITTTRSNNNNIEINNRAEWKQRNEVQRLIRIDIQAKREASLTLYNIAWQVTHSCTCTFRVLFYILLPEVLLYLIIVPLYRHRIISSRLLLIFNFQFKVRYQLLPLFFLARRAKR